MAQNTDLSELDGYFDEAGVVSANHSVLPNF